ncbi:MAG: hypothetical protein RH917_06215 [Lacipirellulaceae bacterium]
MNQQELMGLVRDAVDQLYKNDDSLIERGVHEVAISHHLASYIAEGMGHRCKHSYHVDIEYNKNMNEVKRLVPEEEGKRPDIIVHRRQSNDHNLLIVELKKNQPVLANDDDDRKLKGATTDQGDFRFKLGVYLNLRAEGVSYTWYANGGCVEVSQL